MGIKKIVQANNYGPSATASAILTAHASQKAQIEPLSLVLDSMQR